MKRHQNLDEKCQELLRELENAKLARKRELLIAIGDNNCTNAYEILERYATNRELKHQALIAMARLNYEPTKERIMEKIKKTPKDRRTQQTLSCIFTDRIDTIGEKSFLKEIGYLRGLESETRKVVYNILEDSVRFAEKIEDCSIYLAKAKEILVI